MKQFKIYFILFIIYLSISLAPRAEAEVIDWDRLIPAIIEVESGGNPYAVSKCGAIGLMQITPIVLRECNIYSMFRKVEDYELFVPEKNIAIGTWYLHRLQDHYGCDTLDKILMGYNWGIGNCRKHNFDLKKAPKETWNYVRKVKAIYEKGASK